MNTTKTYSLSSAGRRTTLVLLIGSLLIWLFAFWTLRSTLNLSYHPLRFFSSLQAAISQGLTISQIIPALLMLVIIIATPLVVWNLLEEWSAVYAVDKAGLRFSAMGFSLLYPWTAVQAIGAVDSDADDPMDELLLEQDAGAQIANPLVRWLHNQAYGRRRLPIYAGLEQRQELIETIQQYRSSEFGNQRMGELEVSG